ncbi:hypothetical protein POTOM_039352 [Populus tomentosa]|uniref:Uncharacterized protein n=1 Tax=Populus tomentosa TaxID=118781 RepID=A0A8X8CIU7_POPTO|nr:hypothetical protein POTOM_039352 [Populus tomentosa]
MRIQDVNRSNAPNTKTKSYRWKSCGSDCKLQQDENHIRYGNSSAWKFGLAMTIAYGNHAPTPTRPGGKHKGIVVCWFLGLGSLVSWNSMLTIGDYYYCLFPKYHPSRVLTLVYQPFALGTMAMLAYNEAKINTRKRNVAGYILFAASTLMLMVVDLATSGGGGIGPFIGICAIVAAFGVEDAHVLETWLSCSFFAGLATSGALASALRLITKAAFDKSKDGLRKGVKLCLQALAEKYDENIEVGHELNKMLFLGISTFLEFLCVLLYAYLFPKLPIVKYYRSKAASEGSKTVSADLAAAGIQTLANQELKYSLALLNQIIFLLWSASPKMRSLSYKNHKFPPKMLVLAEKYFPLKELQRKRTHFLQERDCSLIVLAKQASAKLKSGFLQAADAAKPPGRLSNKQLIFQNIDYALDLYLIYVLTLSIFPGFLFENSTGKHKLGNTWYPLVLIAMYNVLDLISRYIPLVPYLKLESRNGLLVAGPEANALGNLLVLFLLGGIFSGVALDWLWLIGKNKAFWSAKPACN